jgi:hypothetical protein
MQASGEMPPIPIAQGNPSNRSEVGFIWKLFWCLSICALKTNVSRNQTKGGQLLKS